MSVRPVWRGFVWLVGAGPGDPELLTVKALRLIREADVVAYDELVSREVLDVARRQAELVPVGRRASGCRHHEARIHPRVVEAALEGKTVVRLKGGDPFVFGRGGEEAEELAAARVPFDVVPGITAALAAAARTHIPLTHRECSGAVTFLTAHASDGVVRRLPAPNGGTVAIYMGLSQVAQTCRALVGQGWDARTPACAVSQATTPNEAIVYATLETLAREMSDSNLNPPTLILIGEVVSRRVQVDAVSLASVDVTEGGRRAS